MSTRKLALANPDSAVLGVDRSANRLSKSSTYEVSLLPPNALLVRSELATFWRLMVAAEASDGALTASRVSSHYLLYPNPFPKPKRLSLRWHGHASLPCLLAIGDRLEVRSNWRVYLEEFEQAAATVAAMAAAATDDDGRHATVGSHSSEAAEASAAATRAWQFACRRASLWHQSASAGGVGTIEELVLADEGDALTSFERRYHLSGEPLYTLEMPPAKPPADPTTMRAGAAPRRAGRGAMMMAAADEGGDDGGDGAAALAARLKAAENEARAAKAAASEAQNAEARLRNMVASAERNAADAYAARLNAEEARDDVAEELAALREVYRMDVDGLSASVEDLEAEVKTLQAQLEEAAGGEGAAGGAGGARGGGEGALLAKVAELEEELAGTRMQAMRAEAAASDLQAELEASRTLASLELAAVAEEVDGLRLELGAAEREVAKAKLGLTDEGRSAEDAATIADLRGQLAELLEAFQSTEAAGMELMQLRPKLAQLERELQEARQGAFEEKQRAKGKEEEEEVEEEEEE